VEAEAEAAALLDAKPASSAVEPPALRCPERLFGLELSAVGLAPTFSAGSEPVKGLDTLPFPTILLSRVRFGDIGDAGDIGSEPSRLAGDVGAKANRSIPDVLPNGEHSALSLPLSRLLAEPFSFASQPFATAPADPGRLSPRSRCFNFCDALSSSKLVRGSTTLRLCIPYSSGVRLPLGGRWFISGVKSARSWLRPGSGVRLPLAL